ncbi:MAG TPA: nitrate- and nitrite sensing domain-containing protein [Actinomycetota bacterium]|nr:nitrate- and nitrite sensing domain-containing protein [Actinomycetota bacterium]
MFGNLSIRSKLLALLAVPVAATVLLDVAGVTAAWGDRARASDERRAAAVAGQAVAAVHELQEERVRAAAWIAGKGQDGRGELRNRRRRVDGALAAYRAGAAGLGPTGDPALDQAVAVATERLDRLAVVRVEVDRRLVTPARVLAGHDAMVDALLGVTRGLAARLEAPAPASSARLLLALTAAKEATGQERVVLAAVPARAAARDESLRLRLAATAAVARQELNRVRADAGSHLEAIDRALGVPGARGARRLELALLDPAGDPAGVGDLDLWRAGLTARAGALRRVEREVAGDLAGASGVWLTGQEARLRDRLVLLAVVLVASLAAVLLLWRSPLGRSGAGRDGAIVPGLARRGQALAARQLQLLEELATEEPDPHRRQGLLGVDHLASRLRRTAETLFAVAGTEPAGRWARPVALNVLLRAAIAEAEPGGPSGDGALGRGRRVDLLTTGEVEVEGPPGIDLVHLLAELLDNAAAFSPPAAPIVVTGAGDGDDYLIEVADRGLGMTDEELAWANQRLAGDADRDPASQAAGDRLGLAIAGRLAARNGFVVRLGRSPAGGVTAAVRVPAGLLSTRAPAAVRHG